MAFNPLILVVDDTAAARRATVLVLERAGFRVAEAADGATALRSVSELRPDLVLLDAVLPDLGGMEVLRRLRAEPQFALIPIVILSSRLTKPADQAEGLDAGADGYIARPIGNVELVARVRALLRNMELSRQLRESEARFRELITQQVDGLLVVDAEGCIRFANPAAARIFGRQSEDLVGYPFGFPISSGAAVQIDVPGAAAPGRILEFSASATRWDDQPAHLISLRDVTEQRLAERNLRESEKRLSGIFQQSAAGIFLASLDGQYLRVNQRFCEIISRTEAEILARNSTETTHPDDRPLESTMTATMLAGGLSSPSWDKRYLRQDGSAVWTNLTLSLLRDEEGQPQQYVGVVIDITQRKVADELVRARARQQETIARIGLEATRTTTLQGIFDFATGAVAQALGVELCKVLQLAPDGSHLRLVSGVGWQPGLIGVGTVGVDRESQAGFTLKADGAIYVNDFAKETRFAAPPLLRDHDVVSGLSVKIMLRDKPWGVLGAHCRTVRTFSDVDADFMQAVATLLAVVMERLAVQRTLTESEARMREAQRIAHLGNWELDIAKNELIWSDEVFRIFGIEPSAFAATYEGFLALVHPDDRHMMQAAQQAVLSGRGRLDFEHRIIRPDGSIRYVRERGELISDANGQPVVLSGTVLDTTDLRAAQSQAERMNTLLTDAQRIAAMGSWEMDLTSGRLIWSEETCRLFGIQPEQFGGTFETFTSFVLPEDQAALRAVYAGITPEAPLLEAEYRIRRPDGEVRWMFERGRVTFDAAGKVIRRLGVVMDVTKRKRAEADRDRMFNLSLDPLAIASFDGRFLQVNPAWTECLGWSAEELRSRPWLEFVHPDDRTITTETVERLIRGENVEAFENRHFCKDGSVRWLAWKAHPLPELRQLFAVARDVTRQRADAERMRLLDACIARLNDVVLITDLVELDEPGPRIIYANEAFERLTGYSREEAIGRSPRFLQGPKTKREELDRIRASLTRGETVRAELLNYAKDGAEYWVEMEIVPVPDATGRLTRAIAIQRDVTDRKRADDQRQRNQALLRMAGRAARLGGWSLHLASGKLIWSEETCHIHEESPGTQPDLETGISYYVPAYRGMVTERVRACLEAGQPFDFEAEIVTAKGRRLWVRAVGEAVRDAGGAITGMEGAFQDITPLKLAEQSVEESQRRFRQLAESMPYIVWTARPDGVVDYSNQVFSDYTGVPQSEPPDTRWQACVHPEDLSACLQQWNRCVRDETPYSIEYRLRRGQDGAYRWFRVQATPVRDSQGQLVKWYGTGLDVDETKRLQQEATGLADRLTTTFESLTDGFVALDTAWRFSYVNHRAVELVRRSREELIGNVVWELFPEAVGSTFEQQYRHAVATGTSVTFEEYFPPLEAWFEVRAFPSAAGLAIYFHDVTERRRTRQILRQSEERFRLLARATNDAIWDWNLIDDSRWWNDGLDALFGYRPTEVEPTSVSWESRIHPDDRGRVMAGIRTAIQSKAETWSDEYRFTRKDGSHAYVLDRGYIIRDEAGKSVRMIGGMTDLSDRRAAEERLEEQATLLDKAQDAILVRDLEHRILYWNMSAERLYGWTAAEVIGRSARELHYREASAFDAATRETLTKGEWVGEIEQYTKAGGKISVEGHWTLVRDYRGNPKSILVINTDITQRKKLEQQFLRAQRMESIGTLAGGIAHDLNNLLAPIAMGVDLLRRYQQDPRSHAIIDTIGRSAKRGADLVKQVLSFARGVEGERVPIRVPHLVGEIASIVENTFPKNIRLDTAVSDRVSPIGGDPTQINQVLLNLAVNARDAMPEGGVLTISAENVEVDAQYAVMNRGVKAGRYVVITVTDTGTGIPREIVDRIFDPFFTTKEIGKGTGLGLSTVMGIVRSHGGFVNVYSEPGHGSSFKVYLPTLSDDDSETAKESADGEQFPRGNGEVIMVVDDEASILDITKQTLEAFGYRVITADDGAQAIGQFALAREPIKLVLTDMMMPIMDGPSLIAALRRIDPQVRIIAASGLNANGNVAKAANLGVKHFLPKPYTADTLLIALQRVLSEDPPPA